MGATRRLELKKAALAGGDLVTFLDKTGTIGCQCGLFQPVRQLWIRMHET
jgi:hypothetical protein